MPPLIIGTTQTVTLAKKNHRSAAITSSVRLTATHGCHISISLNPNATSQDMYLPADTPLHVTPPSGHKIASILHSLSQQETGILYITGINQ